MKKKTLVGWTYKDYDFRNPEFVYVNGLLGHLDLIAEIFPTKKAAIYYFRCDGSEVKKVSITIQELPKRRKKSR